MMKKNTGRRTNQKQMMGSNESTVTFIPSSSPSSLSNVLDDVRSVPTIAMDNSPSTNCASDIPDTTTVSYIDLTHDQDQEDIAIIDQRIIRSTKKKRREHRHRPYPRNDSNTHSSSTPNIVDLSADSPSPSTSTRHGLVEFTLEPNGLLRSELRDPDVAEITAIIRLPPTQQVTSNHVNLTLEQVNPPQPPPQSQPVNIRLIRCPVCLEEDSKIIGNGGQLVSTTCGHVYCKECISQAIKTQRQCPKCRKRLNQKSYHPIFI